MSYPQPQFCPNQGALIKRVQKLFRLCQDADALGADLLGAWRGRIMIANPISDLTNKG